MPLTGMTMTSAAVTYDWFSTTIANSIRLRKNTRFSVGAAGGVLRRKDGVSIRGNGDQTCQSG